MKNKLIFRDEGRSPVVEHRRSTCSRFDVKSTAISFRHDELIGTPGIETLGDCFIMEVSRGLAGELDPVHVSRCLP